MQFNILWLLFSTRGRMNRKGYLASFCVTVIACIMYDRLMVVEERMARIMPRTIMVTLIELIIVSGAMVSILMVFWINVAQIVKRLHDLGLSGLLVVSLVVLGLVLSAYLPPQCYIVFVGLTLLLFGGCPGTKDENKYGRPNKSLFPKSLNSKVR